MALYDTNKNLIAGSRKTNIYAVTNKKKGASMSFSSRLALPIRKDAERVRFAIGIPLT